MSRARAARDRVAPAVAPESTPEQSTARGTISPLRPRPKLFAILVASFCAWIVMLLVMYFLTVYGRPHAH